MNNSIYLCYKRSLTSIIAASLVFKTKEQWLCSNLQ